MGALSKLDAVNRILVAAGEFPVSSLTVSGSNDVTIAVQMLDEAAIMVQINGTNTNTIYTTLTPDVNGKIFVADNVIHVDTVAESMNRNVAVQGRTPTYLIDLDNEGTDVFDADTSLKVKMVVNLLFDDLETADQFYATDLAARRYQFLTVGDKATDVILNEQFQLSYIQARAKDIRARDANFMDNTKSYWGSIGGRRRFGPY